MTLGKAGAAGAAAGLATAFTGAIVVTDQYQAALANVQAGTGATDAETKKLGQSMQNIYANNYGQDFNEIGEAMKYTAQTTGLTGKALEGLTQNGLMLQQRMGYDVTQSVQTADTMMKQFGITGDQAMTLIAQGQQEGIDKSGDMLDSFNEYSVYFKTLGFDAEGMFNIFNAGMKGGAFNADKVGDSIKELGIRVKDGSKTTTDAFKGLGLNADATAQAFAKGGQSSQDALTKIFAGLAKIEDPVKRNTIGVQLFGTQFEDLEYKTIAALGNVENKANMTGDTLKKMDAVKYDSLGSALQGIGRMMVVEVINPIQSKVMPAINDMINGIRQNLPQLKAAFSEAFNAIINGVMKFAPTFESLFTIFKNVGGLVGSTLVVAFSALSSILAPIINYVTGIAAAFTSWSGFAPLIAGIAAGFLAYKTYVMALRAPMMAIAVATRVWAIAQAALNVAMSLNPIGLIIAAIVGLGVALYVAYQKSETFRNAVNGLWNGIKTAAMAVFNWFATAIPALITAISSGWTNMISSIKAAFAALGSWFSTFWNSLKASTMAIIQGFISAIVAGWSGLVSGISAALSAIGSFFSTTWTNIKTTTMSIVTGFVSAIVSAWSNFTSAISSVWSTVASFFATAWNNIKTVTMNIITGFITAIKTGFSNFVSNISFIFAPLAGFFSTAWNNIKIVTMGIILAFISLITGNFSDLKFALQSIWSAVKSTITTAISAIKETGIRLFTVLKSGVINIFNGIKSAASTAWNGLKTAVVTAVNATKSGAINAFNALKSGVINVVNAVKSGAIKGFTALKTGAVNAVNALKSGAINGFNALKSGAVNAVNALKSGAVNSFNALKSGAVNAVNALKSGAVNAFNALKSGAINAVNSLKSGAVNAFNAMKSAMSSAMSAIKSAITSGFNAAKSAAISAMNGLKSAVTSAISKIKSTFTSMKTSIVSTLKSINLRSIGSNMIQGLIGGIQSKAAAVKAKITDLANSIKSKMKSMMDIHSPSRVFREFGGYIGEGLAIGIDKSKKMVLDSTEALGNAAMIDPEAVGVGSLTGDTVAAAVPKDSGSNGSTGGAGVQTNYNAPLMNIENYYQNDETDVREVSRGLYNLQVDHDRGKGK
jgi:phage-related minor tail protein